MNRAAVIIAVRKAGDLTVLQAAHDGAKQMSDWMNAHGFSKVHMITDEDGAPVKAWRIKEAINKVIEDTSLQQLFIYFAGHGVNLRYSEYWLLSDFLNDTQEAVNVSSSVQLAKRCGIPHVVFISDACRTAPEGIRAQAIVGSEIFQNKAAAGPAMAVDVFYASLLGEPALEIKEPGDSAARYRSLYTEEFLAALRGQRPGLLDLTNPPRKYLRPHRLKRHLRDEVPLKVAEFLNSITAKVQTPDADILSDEFAYLQDFEPEVLANEDQVVRSSDVAKPPLTPAQRTLELVQNGLRADPGQFRANVTFSLNRPAFNNVKAVSDAVERETVGFGPLHFETGCGFKVQGALIKAVHGGAHNVGLLSQRDAAHVYLNGEPIGNVMLEMEDGRAVLLPAIRDFIAALTFRGEDLIQISYEPSDRGWRWHEYQQVRDEITALRATIAASVHMGMFRLNEEEAPKLTERIRVMKGLDPTLAIYAAYSYHRMGKTQIIRDMQQYLVEDLHAKLFDVAMLSEDFSWQASPWRTCPFFPMLAQGWSLLGAFDAVSPELRTLQPYVATNSLWTVFHAPAIPILLNLINR